ncbi:SDR family NAD(P)-dependent oxidoreductase [Motilibacter aurantiacus]|uniref:SDR family NAD(P)-dependent oxidoreductase n=1 Tax=Motilibacter aurantiacus TaxID=2714955 RepID=UPI0038B2E796
MALAVRDRERGESALERVRAVAPRTPSSVTLLDLADLASVRALAAREREYALPLGLLVCNAGVYAGSRQRTVDGHELMVGTNHLGHFALTGLLAPRLAAAPSARVVVVSSLAAATAGTPGLGEQEDAPFRGWRAYAGSKLANLLFAAELARRAPALRGDVTVAAAHPGWARTRLLTRRGPGLGSLVTAPAAATLLVQGPDAGAAPVLRAATAPDVRPGDYYGPGGPGQLRGAAVRVELPPLARDEALAAALWHRSEQETGVDYRGRGTSPVGPAALGAEPTTSS